MHHSSAALASISRSIILRRTPTGGTCCCRSSSHDLPPADHSLWLLECRRFLLASAKLGNSSRSCSAGNRAAAEVRPHCVLHPAGVPPAGRVRVWVLAPPCRSSCAIRAFSLNFRAARQQPSLARMQASGSFASLPTLGLCLLALIAGAALSTFLHVGPSARSCPPCTRTNTASTSHPSKNPMVFMGPRPRVLLFGEADPPVALSAVLRPWLLATQSRPAKQVLRQTPKPSSANTRRVL